MSSIALRRFASFLLSLLLLSGLLATGTDPALAAAADQKVVIIVGPVGDLTDYYRSSATRVADEAEDRGAEVVTVFSPQATWANVRDAVDGANIIVYFGHGNGYPNPYGDTQLTDRTNGWGLNINTVSGDRDVIGTSLVYCGEKALLGTLGAGDGAAQRQHCTGGPITPAPNFVMIYANACYAPGAGEGHDPKARVKDHTDVASSTAQANPWAGAGGSPQYFFDDLEGSTETMIRYVGLDSPAPYSNWSP